MSSIARATVWEFTRRARYTFATVWFASIILPIVIYGLLLYTIPFQEIPELDRSQMLAWLELSCLLFCLIVFGLAAVSLQDALPGLRVGGGPGRLYTLPLATWRLALGQLLCGMAMMVLLYLMTAVLVNLVFGVGWQITGPVLFVVVTHACLHAAVWNTLRLGLLQLAACVVAGAPLFLWIKSHYGPLADNVEHGFSPVGPLEAAVMLLVTAVGLAIAVAGIARDRRGDMQGWLAARQWLRNQVERLPGRSAGFASAGRAQVWYEWREKGWIALAAFVGMFALLQTIHALSETTLSGALQAVPAVGVCATIAASFAIALSLGHANMPRGSLEYTTFLATRPASDKALAAAVLKTALIGTVGVWILCLAALLAAVLLLWLADERSLLEMRRELLATRGRSNIVFLGVVIASWALPALFVPIGLTGRRKLLLGTLIAIPALLLAWIALVQHWLPQWLAEIARPATAYALSVLLVGGAAAAFWLAGRAQQSLLSMPKAALSWAVCCGIAAIGFAGMDDISWPGVAVLAGVLALAISPLATAPLAVSWNRHR